MAEEPILLRQTKANTGMYRLDHPQAATLNGEYPVLVPLAVDTEYTQLPWERICAGETIKGRQGVTVQVQAALAKRPMIFVHPDHVQYLRTVNQPLRHPMFTSGFCPVDYLRACGYPCVLSRQGSVETVRHLKPLCFRLYAHFALAEFEMLASGDFREDLYMLYHQDKAVMTRRFFLQERDENGKRISDTVTLPWMLEIGPSAYRVDVCYVDTSAIHGKASYKQFCANVGIDLDAKDSMHDLGMITRMHEAEWRYPEEFDAYALGDLHVFDAFTANVENMREIYQALDLLPFYRGEPRLTIGATVRDLFKARIAKLFDLEPGNSKAMKPIVSHYLSHATAINLRQQTEGTACLLAKTEGGRCRNAYPTLAHLVATIVDLDLAGCYGEGQRNQLYPFGVPFLYEFPRNTTENSYKTLRQFLDVLGHNKSKSELVPGLWHARVSLSEGYRLQDPQDFLASWFGYSVKGMAQTIAALEKHLVSDSCEEPDYELDVHTGELKIFTHEIRDAVVTHDFVQWLEQICSPAQRDELLDHLYVQAAMFYPASERVHSIAELQDRVHNHTGKNDCIMAIEEGLLTKYVKHQECYAWYGVNLGEFLIESLIAQRKMHPKETPLNELYKLMINTSYGVMVSPFFDISNTTVGNNITARARAACWYMEHGLRMFQSITDGGTFDLNKVVFPRDDKSRLRAHRLVSMYTLDGRDLDKTRHVKLAPLGRYERIDIHWFLDAHGKHQPIFDLYHNGTVEQTLHSHDAMNWLNTTAMQHLQDVFPKVDVLHSASKRLVVEKTGKGPTVSYEPRVGQFEFEAKDVYYEGKFHGSANYELLHHDPKRNTLKMRSYEKKRHDTVELDGDTLASGTYYDHATPAHIFMKSLEKPHRVKRSKTFIKSGILKPGEYLHNYQSRFADSALRPGDTIYRTGLLREFSMAQFTFQTRQQYLSIKKQWLRQKERFGQYLEAYFINPDGTLDFQAMIQCIDQGIREGCENLLELLDPQRNEHKRNGKYHPDQKTLNTTRQRLKESGEVVSDELYYALDDMLFSDDIEDFRYQAE